jgi:hypothetical protein
MPLNIVEPNLEKVKPELHALYVKQSDGKFKLALSDFDQHVENQLKPLKSDLEITREHERKLLLENGLGAALRQANLDPHYEKLVIANLDDRLAIETVNNKRVVRIKDDKGGMPMLGTGADGLATLGDLANEAAKTFSSMFKADPSGNGGMPGPLLSTVGKVLTRSEFDKLQPVERSKKMREGYKIVDDPASARPANRPLPKPGEKVMTREAFDQLSPIARSDKILKEGFKIVD